MKISEVYDIKNLDNLKDCFFTLKTHSIVTLVHRI